MSTDYQRWVCDACGYIYEEAKGDPDSGLAPGTRYEDIPDDWMCPLCGLSKSDLRLLPEQPAAPARAPSAARKFGSASKNAGSKNRGSADTVVVVGAGIAAWSVAEEIRKQDADTPVLLVTACEGASYPKPALSTALAHGKSADDLVDLDATSKAAELSVDIRTETRVIKLDTGKKKLTTSKGSIQYGKLVLAMGAHQRELPVSGSAAKTILRVNDLSSYRKLRARLSDQVEHITILGAGLIGCEFAEDLTAAGYRVTVIDPADWPLASLVPEATGRQLQERLVAKGVEWQFGVTLDALDESADQLRATLSDGQAIETDLVLSAAGLLPNTQLAEKSGLATNRGIAVDRRMCTSAADVYAVGDCADVEGRVYAYIEPIRRQAQTIAAHLQGQDQPFAIQAPLVRVKTPSFPLTICPPDSQEVNGATPRTMDEDRVDFIEGDHLVGFILSGDASRGATQLYRDLVAGAV